MKCIERIESSLHSPNAHLPSEDVFWNWIMRMCGITSSSKMPSLSLVLSGQFGFGRVPQSHTQRERGGKELGRVREREASGNQMNLIFNDALRLGKICCNICSWWDSKPEAGSCRVAMPFHRVSVCVCVYGVQYAARCTRFTGIIYIRPIHGILFACNFSLLWNRFACLTIVFISDSFTIYLYFFRLHFCVLLLCCCCLFR